MLLAFKSPRAMALVFGLLVLVSPTLVFAGEAAPDDSGRIRLETRMSGSGMKGKARYEERSERNRRKFNFQIERATPGAQGTVQSGGVTLGSFTVNAFRRGTIDIDTSEGDQVVALSEGDAIVVLIDGQEVMRGRLRQR